MSRHVLERSEHVLRTDNRIDSLKPSDGRDAHAPYEVGILAVRFLESSPPRLTRYVDDRCQHLTDAARPRFGRRGGKDALDKIDIPGARQRNRLRKARRAVRLEAV